MTPVYRVRLKPWCWAVLFFIVICMSAVGCSPKIEPGTVLIVEGDAVEARMSFTLEELKAAEEGLVEADYFGINSYGSKGYSHFRGIWIGYLLRNLVGLQDDASLVSFIAEDGYQVEFSLEDVVKEDYIDEQNPSVKLKMILAWEENGTESDPQTGYPLQLVVGQREPGDVNKPYWVRNVNTIRVD